MQHREVRLGGTNVPVHVRGQLQIRSGGHISGICGSTRSSLRASFGQVCSLGGGWGVSSITLYNGSIFLIIPSLRRNHCTRSS